MKYGDPGSVETGVRYSMAQLGIDTPTTALECLAIKLAQGIDQSKYAKDLPPLAEKLMTAMEKVADQPAKKADRVEEMAGRY